MDKNNSKKAWYKKWWVWVIIIIALIGIGGAAGGNTDTSNNSPKTDTQASSSEQKQINTSNKPKEEKWNVETAYAKLKDGMTKKEAEKAIGKTSDDCSETSAQYVGKLETCNYGGIGDNGIITVQYDNGKLTSKSKSKF